MVLYLLTFMWTNILVFHTYKTESTVVRDKLVADKIVRRKWYADKMLLNKNNGRDKMA